MRAANLRRADDCAVGRARVEEGERGGGVLERERVRVHHAGGDGGEVPVDEEGAGGGAGGAVHSAVGGARAADVLGELAEQAHAARVNGARGLGVEEHHAAALA